MTSTACGMSVLELCANIVYRIVDLFYVKSVICLLLLLLLLQPLNGLFSRTTWVSRYQKGKTNLDFTVATDSE